MTLFPWRKTDHDIYRIFAVFHRVFIPLTLCCLFIAIVPGFAQTPGQVTLTTHNLFPYGAFPDDQKIKKIADNTFRGVAADLVRCACRKLKTSLVIRVVPWKRAQKEVYSGLADGFFAGSQNTFREKNAVRSIQIADQKWQWYLLKDNPLSPANAHFKKEARVAGFIGANMLKWMEENEFNITARPRNTKGLLRLLSAGRVDAVMANNHVMGALLKRDQLEDNVKIFIEKDKPLYVYFSKQFIKDYPRFMDRFNESVTECRASGK